MPPNSTTNKIQAEGETAPGIECALLDLANKVFTYSKAEQRAEGRNSRATSLSRQETPS